MRDPEGLLLRILYIQVLLGIHSCTLLYGQYYIVCVWTCKLAKKGDLYCTV